MAEKAALQENAPVRSVSISQWCEWARSGTAPAVTIRLDGDSMRPLVRRNRDAVTIQPLTRPLRRGDVVLFRSHAGQHIVHRVWKLRGEAVQTVGDNCWNPDPWISAEQVLGLVVSVRRDERVRRLDTRLSRWAGRVWMACRPMRNLRRGVQVRAVRMVSKLRRQRR